MDDFLNEVKFQLRVTWDEEDIDLIQLMERAKAYVDEKAGVNVDLAEDHRARELFLNRCRYAYNHVLEEFETNFLSDINAMQIRYALAEMSDNDEQA